MKLNAFLLHECDYAIFQEPFFFFWIDTIIESFIFIDLYIEPLLDELIAELRLYYLNSNRSINLAVRDKIERWKGKEFPKDNTPLGRKYRCLYAIATTIEVNMSDIDDWVYGIVTSFELINFKNDKDDVIIQFIKDRWASSAIAESA